MSSQSLNNSAFNELEDEIKQEFFEDVVSAINDVNECANLLESGTDAQVIDRMFRALHTVKGNCNMVFLEEFVETSHKLEDLFSDIRSGDIEYQDVFGQFAVVVINEIQKQLESLIQSQQTDLDILKKLESIIDKIENFPGSERASAAEKAIIAINDGHFNLDLVAIDNEHGRAFSFADATDMEFFEFIADKLGSANSEHELFVKVTEEIALALNDKLGRKAEIQQLKAAIFLLTLSNAIRPEDSKYQLALDQIFFASGILNRIPGWSDASELVIKSLENHDGSGLPNGLKEEQIEPAAQVLGLAFEFGYLVVNHFSLGYKQSLFTAVKAINAQKDTRYKARLIERFNALIKTEYLTAQKW